MNVKLYIFFLQVNELGKVRRQLEVSGRIKTSLLEDDDDDDDDDDAEGMCGLGKKAIARHQVGHYAGCKLDKTICSTIMSTLVPGSTQPPTQLALGGGLYPGG